MWVGGWVPCVNTRDARYVKHTPLPHTSNQQPPPKQEEVAKTAERVLRKAAFTPAFLLHDVVVVAAAAALVGQILAHQQDGEAMR